MNVTTLINNIRNAIHDDASTKSWATAAYGRNHKVYVGMDMRHPPNVDAYPLVHVFPMRRSVGYDLQRQDNVIGIVCGIYEEDLLAVTGKANIIEMKSISYIEAFRKLVETAATGADLLGGFVDAINIDYELIESFPFAFAFMELSIGIDYYTGNNPLS